MRPDRGGLDTELIRKHLERLDKTGRRDHLTRLRALRFIAQQIDSEINREILAAREVPPPGGRCCSLKQIADAMELKSPQAAQRRYLAAASARDGDLRTQMEGRRVDRVPKPRTMTALKTKRAC